MVAWLAAMSDLADSRDFHQSKEWGIWTCLRMGRVCGSPLPTATWGKNGRCLLLQQTQLLRPIPLHLPRLLESDIAGWRINGRPLHQFADGQTLDERVVAAEAGRVIVAGLRLLALHRAHQVAHIAAAHLAAFYLYWP